MTYDPFKLPNLNDNSFQTEWSSARSAPRTLVRVAFLFLVLVLCRMDIKIPDKPLHYLQRHPTTVLRFIFEFLINKVKFMYLFRTRRMRTAQDRSVSETWGSLTSSGCLSTDVVKYLSQLYITGYYCTKMKS